MVKKIFLDTNIWLRFLLQDDKRQGQECIKLMEMIESGYFRPYTGSIVLMEVNYALTSIYEVKQDKVIADLEAILKTRNLTLADKMNFAEALKLCEKTRVKLVDCLIATSLRKGMVLCSYDKEFKKFKDMQVKTPGDLIQ